MRRAVPVRLSLRAAVRPALALAAHRHPGVRAVRLPGDGRHVFAAVHGQPPDPPATAALLAHLAAAGRTLRLPGTNRNST